MISGPNLRIASFGNNQLLQIQPSIFGDTSALVYLGMDGNNITRISKNSLAPLATSVFFHLNLSNNALEFIQPSTFNQLPEIKILDLHANNLVHLGSKSFTNLPSLKELRLHSQKTPMESIAYDAWNNINDSLIELFVSSNALSTFPHQVMEESYYPNLGIMHADNNLITNITEYGTEAFPASQYFLHARKQQAYTPFAAMPNLRIMYLHSNLITYINTTNLCNMTILEELYIGDNLIRESTLDVDCFACLSFLWNIDMPTNLIQYVPEAVRSIDVVPALTRLNMNENKLTFIATGAFTNDTLLDTLLLDSNLILTVENDSLPNSLVTLDMGNNEFRFLHTDPFRYLYNLNTLSLDNNYIQYLPDTAFDNCTSLNNLDLQSNNIAQLLKVHFANCPLSGTVSFSNNDIGWIEDGTFDNITSMLSLFLGSNKLTTLPNGGDFSDLTVAFYLDLSSNRINILEENTFTNLVVGESLRLENNQITAVYGNAFNSVSTKYLSFAGNPLRLLYSYSFNDVSVSETFTMSSLYFTNVPWRAFTNVYAKRMYMNSGFISTIEEEAFTNFTAYYFYLNDNYINIITNKLFGGTSAVTVFSLEDNELYAITYDGFSDVDLYDIYLSNNNLTLYPQSLTTQEYHEIHLTSNFITELPTGSLYNQTSLYELNMNDNLLEYIEAGAFRDLTGLNTLSITGNQLQTLPESLLENMTSLQYLYLSGNNMTHVHSLTNNVNLRTADFSDNSIETLATNAFNGLTNLGILGLGNNPLECSCQFVITIEQAISAVTSATCAASTDAVGVTFGSASDPLYYTNVDTTAFQCSGDNVASTVTNGTQFTITWDQPSYIYYQTNASIASPSLVGPVDYEIVCRSSSSATITKYRSDGDAGAGSTSFSKTFTSSDGVQTGTTYECAIIVDINGTVSAKSAPAVFTTPDQAASQGTPGPDDVVLDVIYHDFSKLTDDFDDLEYVTLSTATYVDSPYGAWLTDSSHANFLNWFHDDSSTVRVVDDTLILVHQSGTLKRYYSSAFFPVDGLGYGAESQQDCSGQYHNFGFTTAIRTGLNYSGTEMITLGGGEGMWLFINKIKIFEFVATASLQGACFVVDLSTATENGGYVTVQEGTLSGSTCSGLTPALSNVALELEVGVTYHFDLYHVDNRRCKSELLFEIEDTTFSTDKTIDLPIDYSVTWDEDTQIGEILEDVILNDVFTTAPFSVDLYKGNEERRFTLEPSTYTFTPAAVPAPSYTYIYDQYGNNISYVECNSTSPLVVMGNDASVETFSISTTNMYVALADELDYEVTTRYYLLVQVDATSNSLTGYIGIRIIIGDVNDNCPILSPTDITLTPQPVLTDSPLATFTSSDNDSGENANIRYVVSSITEDPGTPFDDTYDLWGDVYLKYTSLIFDVIAMDNGTVPLGMKATMNITVSNTCVLDVLFGKITYLFLVDDVTGEMTLRIPKYWVYDFPCSDLLGLISGVVLDSMMSASSTFHPISTAPGRARLNQIENVYSELAGAWVAGVVDTNQYVEVDMGLPYRFTKVYIQGRSDADEWVTSFQLLYYDDTTSSWLSYTNVNGTTIYTGNTDRTTVVEYDLDPPLLSDKVRVNPQTWNGGNISMRLEFNGCSQAEQLYYDVSCMRCETTYYCEGEGVQKLCGRCENTTGSCDRNPIEHSFGLQSECQPCPAGWICADGYATPCDELHYVECTNTSCPASCTACEPGYACYNGIRSICPNGTYSDGTMEHCEPCKSGTYQDVEGQSTCKTCPNGYFSGTRKSECEICEPEEWSSDGSECTLCTDATQCPCLNENTCYNLTFCYNTGGGGFGCTPCGDGLTGDGVTCTDIDECALYDPCFQSRCINTEPGYQCLECPDGYNGTYEDAYAYDVHLRVFKYINLERSNFTYQECDDIDECATDNGGCDPLMTCVNTIGSYYCDFCASGYMGTNKSGCYLDNFCISGAHNCIAEADCIYLGPAQYRCVCKPGYAGDGTHCGLDTDNDGHPDTGIPCTDWGCRYDRCVNVPNSMQDDTDKDNIGDNCDDDDDNDGRYDWLDNCQFVSNWNQSDVDGDGYGDACDTCPNLINTDQTDTDNDGDGDDCDSDDDDDGIADGSDNCPLVYNTDQSDSDGDGIGDACDNCPSISNNAQTDTNQNNYGDACDAIGATNIDEDGDSILDSFDNCQSYMNADQSDIDGDGTGDLCDNDIDGDGISNDADNCPYFPNADQADVDGNDVGDICEEDSDADGTLDKNDTCPFNNAINETSFKDYFTVDFYPTLVNTSDPVWLVKNNGGEVMQTASTGKPSLLIGNQPYGAVEYKGTWYTSDLTADKYFGFVFGYVSNRKFYIVMWKGKHYNYMEEDSSTYKGGLQGAQIKLVDSSTGPGSTLAEALWHSYHTTNEVTMLWQDPDLNDWEPLLSYRWYLTHRPTTGYINLKIYQGTTLVTDSGDIYDMTISGGRLGVFQFGEFPMIFSDLKADCLEHTNQGLYFDGVDDFVTLDDALTIGLENSFTLDVWMSLDTGFTTGPYPIICSAESTICLLLDNGQIVGTYGNYTVSSTSTLNADTWYNVIFRHRIEDESISIFIDSVNEATTLSVSKLNLTTVSATTDLTMYIGKQNETYFRGTIDEVSLYFLMSYTVFLYSLFTTTILRTRIV
ncbi:hypothetical protein ACF0H5_015734 [Mactra antiquata]